MNEDAQLKLRLTQELKDFIESEAKANHRTINGEVVFRLEQSRAINKTSQADVRVIDLKNGKRRLIYGKFIKMLDVDFCQSLEGLKKDIELALDALRYSSFSQRLAFFNKEVIVYKGNNHIDIVDNGEGSLGWLRVEDHYSIDDED
ncbi:Arc family DNA-binding protein [Alkanindiges illinoisensis]|uniref:Arc family DNA-binding protein n=1 Tax=Alkanindiges illinoisensis TaxID=197183 RepID=UPI00047D17BC|nr:Arc family DNA-binding protein [Alkanindiges illinoisensis]